jgi:hypothetical protein
LGEARRLDLARVERRCVLGLSYISYGTSCSASQVIKMIDEMVVNLKKEQQDDDHKKERALEG